MEENAPSLELYDIPEVQDLIPRFWMPWWAWLVVLSLAIATYATARAIRRKPRAPRTRSEAFAFAQRQLKQAESIQHGVERSTAVSLILRRYLSLAFADPSLYETHEEFLSRHEALASLPEDLRRALTDFFSTLCRYKYAPTSNPVDLSPIVPQASRLLDQLHALPSPVDSQAS
ncbi:MAG: hypothetical protein RLZZ224_241 [Verrucomicrobiota bacterium]|jgi:hypothetical protein